jgi:uncharacterized membrane-anchored protein YhcB (DUF1043 family)
VPAVSKETPRELQPHDAEVKRVQASRQNPKRREEADLPAMLRAIPAHLRRHFASSAELRGNIGKTHHELAQRPLVGAFAHLPQQPLHRLFDTTQQSVREGDSVSDTRRRPELTVHCTIQMV